MPFISSLFIIPIHSSDCAEQAEQNTDLLLTREFLADSFRAVRMLFSQDIFADARISLLLSVTEASQKLVKVYLQ